MNKDRYYVREACDSDGARLGVYKIHSEAQIMSDTGPKPLRPDYLSQKAKIWPQKWPDGSSAAFADEAKVEDGEEN